MSTEAMKIDIETILANEKDRIQAAVVKQLEDRIAETMRWSIGEQITEITKAYFDEHIKPELLAVLVAQKSAIIESAVAAVVATGEKLRERMVERATKLSDYKLDAVLKEVFSGY